MNESTENNKKVFLDGNKIQIADTEGISYRVLSGMANVFAAPKETDGTPGRRVFLMEAAEGQIIPSLCCEAPKETFSDPVPWCIIIRPSEPTELEIIKSDEEQKRSFCRRLPVKGASDLSFEEAVLEAYQMEIVRDIRNIYVTEKVNDSVHKATAGSIYRMFESGVYEKRLGSNAVNHPLYNAAAAICSWMKIPCASFTEMREACGTRFGIEDLARVSGFTSREVLLRNDWFKEDCGPLLCFTQEGEPVACIPKNHHSYMIYSGKDQSVKRLDEQTAENIRMSGAYMFYRPFPAQKMNLKSIAAFVLHDVQKGDIVRIIVLALLGMFVSLLIPQLNQLIYDTFIPMGTQGALVNFGMILMACSVGSVSFAVVRGFCNFRIMNRCKCTLEAAVYDRLFNLPISMIREYDSADLAGRAEALPGVCQQILSAILSDGLTLLFSLLYLVQMFCFSGKLTLICLVLLIIFGIVVFVFGRKRIKLARHRTDLERENRSRLYQMFTGIDKLRINGAEERGVGEFMKTYSEQGEYQIKGQKQEQFITILSAVIPLFFSIIIFFMIIKEQGGSVTTGNMMLFYSAFGAFSAEVFAAAIQWLQIADMIPEYENAKPILETLPEKQEEMVIPSNLNGEITVSNLSFSYSGTNALVLNDISFHIDPGEYIGIVGGSGSGKSTLLKLLLGFEKPTEGKIYYDGQDIERVDKRELRKKLGVVLQNGGLIAGSIAENVSIARPGSDKAEIEEALDAACMTEEIEEMPMGIFTVLSEGSGGISGGQKQRILIARAIVGKPKILFFDEATSALDNNTQQKVCDSLAGLHSTRVVIAHRLSTIKDCDRIFVLNGGKIAEEGNFETLMAQRGFFYELARRQMAGNADEE